MLKIKLCFLVYKVISFLFTLKPFTFKYTLHSYLPCNCIYPQFFLYLNNSASFFLLWVLSDITTPVHQTTVLQHTSEEVEQGLQLLQGSMAFFRTFSQTQLSAAMKTITCPDCDTAAIIMCIVIWLSLLQCILYDYMIHSLLLFARQHLSVTDFLMHLIRTTDFR